ncbi:hypothetical protein [Vibrio phage vB_VpaP_C2]|nr:hypothetical protein [Vibrio phage vB_VpaP_C2]USL89965.1 hypothetical protein [Vibrio phage vB_VpaP_M3]
MCVRVCALGCVCMWAIQRVRVRACGYPCAIQWKAWESLAIAWAAPVCSMLAFFAHTVRACSPLVSVWLSAGYPLVNIWHL